MVEIKRRKKIIVVKPNDEQEDLYLKETKVKPHWEKIKGGSDQCFVCDKKFRQNHDKKFIGYHKLTGEVLLRHTYCESGSVNWTEKFGDRLTFLNKGVSKSIVKSKPKEAETNTIIQRRKTK